jgi:putative oxidoreductase
MQDFGLLLLRLTVGTLLMGHGSQKLFGWFEGPGLKGTHGFMENLGMRPGRLWGTLAAMGEFNGGLLTALGLAHPLGPLNIAAAMSVATRRAHWGKPIWVSKGGAELALTNLSAAVMLALVGPGRYSLDRLFGIRLPRWMAFMAWITTAGTTIVALRRPELAESVMSKAATVMPGTLRPTSQPDIAVENRPAPEPEPVPTV